MAKRFSQLVITLILLPLFSLAAQKKTIDQIEKVKVNGSKQWLFYRGENKNNPVVMFVHGGPGSPLMYFSRAFDNELVKDFVVVHWDQRNSGKSYNSKQPMESFTADQVSKDGLVLVDHIKKKFNKSKIILIGHSWGAIVGALMAKKKPADFSAYISVGTVADMGLGDSMKYEFLKDKVNKDGDVTDKSDLQKMGPPPWKDFSQIVILSRLMVKFKGSFFALNDKDINLAVTKNKEYSENDFKNLNVSMEKIWQQTWPFLAKYKAINFVPRLDLPVIFVQGQHDMAAPTELAKEYFNQLSAPQGKEWIEFSNSAHFPMYEEPLKFHEVVKKAIPR